MSGVAKSSPAILNSWKEIASYLDRGVRTVQRWERDYSLPVHRMGNGSRSPVYALAPELNFWLVTSGMNSQKPTSAPIAKFKRQHKAGRESPVKLSHELIAKSRDLVRTVAQASARQQRQAELLQKRIVEIRSKIR